MAADTETQPIAAPPKKRRKHRAAITHCFNCQSPVSGRYCAECGQETHDQSVALGTLASELVSEVVSFDSKLARTVLPLLVRPGFLTNEFTQGRRVRYLSPLKMYLVISAVFFVVLAQQNAIRNAKMINIDPGDLPAATRKAALDKGLQGVNQSLAQTKTPEERRQLLKARAQIQQAFGSATPAKPPKKSDQGLHVRLGSHDQDIGALPKTVAAYDSAQKALPPAKRDSRIKRYLLRQLIKTQQSPGQLVQGFLDNLPRMMFVLLPAFAFLLRITYWRTRRLYVSHLIFALHTHAFVFLLLTLALLLPLHLRDNALGVAFLLMTVYLFAALKVVYGQNWPRTTLAFAWLGFNYFALLSIAFLLTLGVAFLLA